MINKSSILNFSEKRLALVFWIYFLAGTLLFGLLYGLAGAAGRFLNINEHIELVFSVFLAIYYLWIVVGLWISAFNVNWIGWGYLVRLFVIYMVLYWLLSL